LYFNEGNTNKGDITFRKNLGKDIIEVEGETNPIKKISIKDLDSLVISFDENYVKIEDINGNSFFIY